MADISNDGEKSEVFQDVSEKVSSKDTKIIFLCRSGARSRSAAEFMTSQGLIIVIIV